MDKILNNRGVTVEKGRWYYYVIGGVIYFGEVVSILSKYGFRDADGSGRELNIRFRGRDNVVFNTTFDSYIYENLEGAEEECRRWGRVRYDETVVREIRR